MCQGQPKHQHQRQQHQHQRQHNHHLVLIRHGESLWNKENRFTGWCDVDLSHHGREQAQKAGILLKEKGYSFDFAFSSVLKRAIRTLWMVLDEMEQMWLPVQCYWQLNERHYGALQGLNKDEIRAQYGKEQVFQWRRSYDIKPPPMKEATLLELKQSLKYSNVPASSIPLSESLKDTQARLLPVWEKEMVPKIKEGKKILIVAHGNSLRALIQHIEKISSKEITQLDIPTGQPISYLLHKEKLTMEAKEILS